MKHNIPVSNFSNGIDINLFYSEIRQTTFKDKVENVGFNDSSVFLNLDEDLTIEELVELGGVVQNHVKVEKTALELKSPELSDFELDYHKTRQDAKVLIVDFASLNANEKLIAAKYCLVEAADIVPFYMAQGLSYADAVKKYKVLRSVDISRAADALAKRAMSPVVLYIAVKYMSESDASAFNDAIRNFIQDLKNTAHLGTEYGQSRDGIMNYIENTGSYAQGGGLTSYSMENGYTHLECKTEFKNYLVYGNKPQEFDVFSS